MESFDGIRLVGYTDDDRKIDEPKTPYVRYDAENDLVLGGKLNPPGYLGHQLILRCTRLRFAKR